MVLAIRDPFKPYCWRLINREDKKSDGKIFGRILVVFLAKFQSFKEKVITRIRFI